MVSRSKLLVVLIAAGGLLLRLPGLTESLWYDELWSTRVMIGSVASLVRTLSADIHPPAFSVLMFFWIRVFGDSEISVRMVPLICGVLTIALTARLAIDYGARSAAPVAALVIALSPAHIWYSQEARPYSFLLLLTVASVVAFHRIRDTHATRWYVAYAVLAAGMVFTQYYAAVYVAAIILLSLTDPRGRVRMASIGLAIAVTLAAFFAVKWQFGVIPTEAGYLRGFGAAELWRLMFEWLIVGGVLGFPAGRATAVRWSVLAVQIALLLLLVRGLRKARAPGSESQPNESRWMALASRGELALLLLGLPLGLLTLDLIGFEHFYIERSGLSVLPFLAIAIAIGVASCTRTLWKVASVALIAAFGTVVLINYYRMSDDWTVYKPNADWRTAARLLAGEHARTGRPVVVLAMTPALELRYYHAGFGPQQLHQPAQEGNANRGTIRERLKRLLVVPVEPLRGQVGRIYEPDESDESDASVVHRIFDRERAPEIFLARNRYWLGSSDDLIESVEADPGLTIEPAFEAKGIRLLRIRRVAPAPRH